MDKQQAQQIIRDTFESSFDKIRFTGFIKNLLNQIDDAPFTYQGNYIPDAYKQYIKTLERLGKFSDRENGIEILVITLQKETSLERARTMQRNVIAWYLNGSRGGEMKDAALVAFVSPGTADWRFSLVKMDYKFEKTKTGKVKVKEEFTPARRWSFLVGANEKSHTAQSRLVDILKDDDNDPTLEEIEKAFDIESVTKEFFLKYRELFLRTKEELDRVVKSDPKIKVDFEAKGVDTVNFAKKLLGQIIFLYFLQKKGWFGVERDAGWGDGSKNFLRELFEGRHGQYMNFFNDILEPLFYDALSRDRSDIDHWNDQFKCKIPFLNGGLFDPIGNYSWYSTDILLSNKLFSNTSKTREGDTGDGILDIFDRYNFTVKEDEPLEKEVAIDPELLGKAYEKFNAIRPDNYDEFKKALKSGKKGEENKFNKKFGVYYTPREIVHYMCQQSLINYLHTVAQASSLSIPQKDIETLIHTGEQVSENEARVLSTGKETRTYSHKLPENIRNNAALIDDKLADITVCDPAVGSGAFPVGMMSEIVSARNVLSVFLNDDSRTVYEFKRRCIEHSLYGVDIDQGAVEIAKLRLWLSLVVDEEDIKNIKPLPNLDYRIMQGNSLISEFMGISFDTNSENNEKTSDLTLFIKDETEELVEQFQKKKDEFLNESNVTKKTKLKEEVEDLLIKIFETKLKAQKADYFNRLKEIENKHSNWPKEEQRKKYIKQDKEKLYKESGFDLESAEKQLKEFTSGRKIKPFFLWNLYFSEVFHNKGGFDVVIANPPYGADISKEQLKQIKSKLINTKNSNSATLFIDFAKNKFINSKGIVTFIVPKSLIFSERWFSLVESLSQKTTILLDVEKGFENVLLEQVVFVYNQSEKVEKYQALKFSGIQFIKKAVVSVSLIKHFKVWLCDVEREEIPIAVKMANNAIFLSQITSTTRGLPLQSSLKKKGEISIIGGKNIQRYAIVGLKGFLNKKDITAFFNKASKLLRPKIISQRLVAHIQNPIPHIQIISTVDLEGDIIGVDTVENTFLNSNEYSLLLILSILNSKLISWYAYKFIFGSAIRTMDFDNYYIGKIPIPKVPKDCQRPFIRGVNRILAITKGDDYLQNPQKQVKVKTLEREIDQMVYKLYGLTEEEIRIVEGR